MPLSEWGRHTEAGKGAIHMPGEKVGKTHCVQQCKSLTQHSPLSKALILPVSQKTHPKTHWIQLTCLAKGHLRATGWKEWNQSLCSEAEFLCLSPMVIKTMHLTLPFVMSILKTFLYPHICHSKAYAPPGHQCTHLPQ